MDLEVTREGVVPQLPLLVLLFMVVPGEGPEVHGGREAVQALQQVILYQDIDGVLSCRTRASSALHPRAPFGRLCAAPHPLPDMLSAHPSPMPVTLAFIHFPDLAFTCQLASLLLFFLF